jgi:hypothetical protein
MASLRSLLLRCTSTVFSVMNTASAISLVGQPSGAVPATRSLLAGVARPRAGLDQLGVCAVGERVGGVLAGQLDGRGQPVARGARLPAHRSAAPRSAGATRRQLPIRRCSVRRGGAPWPSTAAGRPERRSGLVALLSFRNRPTASGAARPCQGQRNTPQTGLVSRETGFVLVAGVPVLTSRGCSDRAHIPIWRTRTSPPGLTKCATSALAFTPSKASPAVWLGPPTDRVVGKQGRASSHLNVDAAVGR